MKLLLTSAGISNKSISNALLELTSKPFNQLNLAFIPTAANVEKGDKDLVNSKSLGFKQIDIVDISAVSKDIWLERLEEADILFFEGGNTAHLRYWLRKSGLDELISEMLKNKIYIGVSAGSMVVTKRGCSLREIEELYEEEKDIKEDMGLGFVNFIILPHFNSSFFPRLTEKNIKKIAEKIPETIYALDDDSAIKFIDGEISVVSEGEWKKFN